MSQILLSGLSFLTSSALSFTFKGWKAPNT
jgi:hypothetical protein